MDTRIYIKDGRIESVDGWSNGRLSEKRDCYEIETWVLKIEHDNVRCYSRVKDEKGISVIESSCKMRNGFVVFNHSRHVLNREIHYYVEKL